MFVVYHWGVSGHFGEENCAWKLSIVKNSLWILLISLVWFFLAQNILIPPLVYYSIQFNSYVIIRLLCKYLLRDIRKKLVCPNISTNTNNLFFITTIFVKVCNKIRQHTSFLHAWQNKFSRRQMIVVETSCTASIFRRQGSKLWKMGAN